MYVRSISVVCFCSELSIPPEDACSFHTKRQLAKKICQVTNNIPFIHPNKVYLTSNPSLNNDHSSLHTLINDDDHNSNDHQSSKRDAAAYDDDDDDDVAQLT